MTEYNELTTKTKKYLNKIKALLDNPVFTLGENRYIKKIEVEDLICCLEASLPAAFKSVIKGKRQSTLQSVKIYKSLMSILRGKKALILSNCYVVFKSILRS